MVAERRIFNMNDPSIPSDPNHLRDTMRKLDQLGPGEHFVIPRDISALLNIPSLRSRLSQVHRGTGIRYRLHWDRRNGTIWVWHDPAPPPPTSLAPLNAAVRDLADGSAEQKVAALETLAEPSQPKYNKGTRSTWCPLSETLKILNLSEEQWAEIPPVTQFRLRIQTGMAVRDTRAAKRNSRQHSREYKQFANHFGVGSK